MPWCPKCRSEYVEGIAECGECKIPLVEKLPEEEISFDDIPKEYMEAIEEAIENGDEIVDARTLLRTQSTYIKRENRYRDMKDSAIALTTVGLVGIIALILIFTGVISLPFTMESMIICYIVFTIIFGIFLMVGLFSFKRAKVLKEEAMEENELTDNINEWLMENFGNRKLTFEKEMDETEIYFERFHVLKEAVEKEYGELDESYVDAIIDELYGQLFPEDEVAEA